MVSLADPELQKRRAKFLTKFLNDLFFRHFPQKVIYHQKFLDDLFLVINLFLKFRKIYNLHYFHYSFFLQGGDQTPLPTSMGGPWPDWPPWIRHCMVLG